MDENSKMVIGAEGVVVPMRQPPIAELFLLGAAGTGQVAMRALWSVVGDVVCR